MNNTVLEILNCVTNFIKNNEDDDYVKDIERIQVSPYGVYINYKLKSSIDLDQIVPVFANGLANGEVIHQGDVFTDDSYQFDIGKDNIPVYAEMSSCNEISIVMNF